MSQAFETGIPSPKQPHFREFAPGTQRLIYPNFIYKAAYNSVMNDSRKWEKIPPNKGCLNKLIYTYG